MHGASNHLGPLSRRRFLMTTAVAAGTLTTSKCTVSHAADRYADLTSADYLGEVRVETRVQDQEIFTEGPAVDAMGNVFFTNVAASKILKWEPAAKALSVFRPNSNKANGLYFDPQGRLLACEGGAGRVTRTDMHSGKIESLAGTFQGLPFAAPNDLCLDQADRIYFTSRSGVQDKAGETPKGVYRIDPDGQVTPVLQWPEVQMPNGIVLSPDDKTLYLIEAHPEANHHRDIRAYDLRPDGTVAKGRVLVNFYPGRSGDGMCIDAAGNLYVAAGLHQLRGTSETLDTKPGIHVISPQGKLLAYRQTPEDTITNCTFGGPDRRTLYVTCGTVLLSIRTTVPGKN